MAPRARVIAAALPVAVGLIAMPAEVGAQAPQVTEIVPPSALPRPGYESRSLRFGRTVVSPELTVSQSYDSNVFALPRNEQDDFVTTVSPRIRVETGPERLRLSSEAFASHSEYWEHPRESRTTLGAALEGRYLVSRTSTVTAAVEHNRDVIPREDPESAVATGDSIGFFNQFGGRLGYAYRRNRLGLSLDGSVNRVDHEEAVHANRDLVEGRLAARASLLMTPKLDTFLEGYATRRDYDAGSDASGVNQDSTTYGFFAGTRVNLSGKLAGEIGVGLFQTDHDDRSLEDFLGLGVRGSLLWSVSPRTLVTATVAREDAGTVLPRASSQIRTDVGLSLEQEVRHNLLLNANLGLSHQEYQGIDRDLTTASASVTGEVLLNRVVSLTLSAGYSTRFADLPADEYDRLTVMLGTRLRF